MLCLFSKGKPDNDIARTWSVAGVVAVTPIFPIENPRVLTTLPSLGYNHSGFPVCSRACVWGVGAAGSSGRIWLMTTLYTTVY